MHSYYTLKDTSNVHGLLIFASHSMEQHDLRPHPHYVEENQSNVFRPRYAEEFKNATITGYFGFCV